MVKALDALTEANQGATIEELAQTLEMSRSAALRLFESMVDTGVAIRTASKRYRPSLAAYDWGLRALAPKAPSLTTRKEMSKLARETQNRVWYAVQERGWSIVLERTEFVEGETVSFPIANRSFWWETASGMVIAAYSPPPVLEELLSFADLHSRQGAMSDELKLSLADVRLKGVAWRSYGDLGIAASAPVLDSSGYASAAIGLTLLRRDGIDTGAVELSVKETAARCSDYLGHSRVLLVT